MVIDTGVAVLTLATMTIGAATQRITGLGLAVLAAPVLALVMGPTVGITVVNLATGISSLIVLTQTRKHIDWQQFWRIGPLLSVGTVAGAVVVDTAPAHWLEVGVGALVLAALAVVFLARQAPKVSGPTPAMLGGLIAGFTNSTAGVASPVLTVYAVASDWPQRSFRATLQPILLMASVASVTAKFAVGAVDPSQLMPWWMWLAATAAICLGVLVGGVLNGHITARQARTFTVAVAAIGAVISIVRGTVGF